MNRILAIDPGPVRSAWLYLEDGKPTDFAISENEELLEKLETAMATWVVLEQVEAMGMAVGREVFETVFWTGRFYQAAYRAGWTTERLTRHAVKLHLCGVRTAKDSNIMTALIDRYGGIEGKRAAVGLKASPGPLYGVSRDVWSALAIAVTWADQHP